MRYLLIGVLMLVSACAMLKDGSAAQRLYEAQGLYNSALVGAVAYAQSPDARQIEIQRLNAANKAVRPAAMFARCFAGGGAKAVVEGVDCTVFTYTEGSIVTYAQALRHAALMLRARTENQP